MFTVTLLLLHFVVVQCTAPHVQHELGFVQSSIGSVRTRFGGSVSVFEDTLVVGASKYYHKNNGTQDEHGAAFVFERGVNGSWTERQKLTATLSPTSYGCGSSVLISKYFPDLIFVGCFGDYNEVGLNAGAVYIFQKIEPVKEYAEKMRLVASDRSTGFGFSLSSFKNTLVVGAPFTSNTVFGKYQGAVYLFSAQTVGDDVVWNQIQKLTPGSKRDCLFGNDVDLAGSVLAVSAPKSSRVYLFELSNATFEQTAILSAPDISVNKSRRFGSSVHVSSDHNSIAVGMEQDKTLGVLSGAVYVFERTRLGWAMTQKLFGSDSCGRDRFGCAVLISEQYIVVGACEAGNTGAVYIFQKQDRWNEVQKLVPDKAGKSRCGTTLLRDGNFLHVGGCDGQSLYTYLFPE